MGKRLFSNNQITAALLVLAVAGIAGCGAPEVETGEAVEALCGNGVKPGCGTCYPDPSSPKGGYR